MCITFAWILDRIMFLRIDLHVRKYFHDDDDDDLQRNPSTTTTTTTTEVFHGVDDDVDDDDQVENILEHTHILKVYKSLHSLAKIIRCF
jgi:hypothetical protein